MRAYGADASCRSFVRRLWALLRTAHEAAAEAALAEAAASCRASLAPALMGSDHLALQQRAGALFLNGLRIRPDVRDFAPTAGLAALMQDCAVAAVLFPRDAGDEDFVALAKAWRRAMAGADLQEQLERCPGAAIAAMRAAVEQGPAAAPPGAGGRKAAATSQLGAVFTMQRLARVLAGDGPFAGQRARGRLQDVVHFLLQAPDAKAALGILEQHEDGMRIPVRACLLAVEAAERMGWTEQGVLAAGAAALTSARFVPGLDAAGRTLAHSAASLASCFDAGQRADALAEEGRLGPPEMATTLLAIRAGAGRSRG